MSKTIIDYLPFYRIPAGRYLTALRQMRSLAAAMEGAGALHQVLSEAVSEAEAQFELDLRWRFRKTHRVEHGEKAGELDQRLDQLLRGVDEILASQQRFAAIRPQRAEAAEAMRRRLFPNGVNALAQLSFNDEANAIFALLKVYDESRDDQGLARELDFAESMEAIRALNLDYSREVSAARPPRREAVQAGRRQSAQRLGEIVARIFGMFPTESPEDQEARAALMEPLEHQNEALRLLYKRHGRSRSADIEANNEDEARLDIDPDAPELEAA